MTPLAANCQCNVWDQSLLILMRESVVVDKVSSGILVFNYQFLSIRTPKNKILNMRLSKTKEQRMVSVSNQNYENLRIGLLQNGFPVNHPLIQVKTREYIEETKVSLEHAKQSTEICRQ